MRNIVYIIGGSSSDILPGSVDFPAGRGSPKPTFTRLFSSCKFDPGNCDPPAYLKTQPAYLSTAIPALSFPIFLPTIINGFGYSSTNAQLLSIAPNATGCVFMLAISFLSDRLRVPGLFVLAGSAVAVSGYAMVFATKAPAAQYGGTVVVAVGLPSSVACQLAWMGGTFGVEVKRAVAIALIVGLRKSWHVRA